MPTSESWCVWPETMSSYPRELGSIVPDEHVPRTGGSHRAGNWLSVLENQVTERLPSRCVYHPPPSSSPASGTGEHFLVFITCSELYKLNMFTLPSEMKKQRLKR